MELPLAVTRAGALRTSQVGVTRNISSAGVLFASQEHSDPGGSIEYVITLPSPGDIQVTVRCIGKVVRCEPTPSPRYRFQVAATLERYEFLRPPA